MVRQVREGVLDFIGAARPSIADPFLPSKIEAGRLEDIRDASAATCAYRETRRCRPSDAPRTRQWAKSGAAVGTRSRFACQASHAYILVVGAGPAGLEASRASGQRGYRVLLVEASRELGGRVAKEAQLPRLAEWRRVVDYRLSQLRKMTNVEIHRESEMTSADVLASGVTDVLVTTGSRWRSDGVGRWHHAGQFQ